MKILLVSDTHGRTNDFIDIVENNKFDYIIHCGDSEEPKEMFYFDLYIVRGNSYNDDNYPYELELNINNIKFFVTHGHQYLVNNGLGLLKEKAIAIGAQVVCFGHTHLPSILKENGILYVNPGSLALPRKSSKASYMVIELKETIKITHYDISNKEISSYETSN